MNYSLLIVGDTLYRFESTSGQTWTLTHYGWATVAEPK